MYLRGKHWLAFAATAVALAACGGPMTNNTEGGAEGGSETGVVDGGREGGTNEAGMNEAGMNEGGTNEGGTREGGTNEGGTGEGGTGGVCAAGSIIDLATAGTVSGGVTHYTGTTANASSTSELDAPCVQSPMNYTNQVAHKYHTMTASHLVVSTDNPGTPSMADTIAWLLPTCGGAGMPDDCNDDVDFFNGNAHSAFTTSDIIPANTDVFIIVGDYGSTQTPPMPGAYELTVQEVAPIPAGGTCDPSGPNLCATGNSCVATNGSTTMGTCNANGTAGAACNSSTSAMRCNAGLVCRADFSGTELCYTAIAGGGACDPTASPDVCADNFSCVGTGSTGTCTANGMAGTQCRPAGGSTPRCDGSLMCVQRSDGVEICVATLAVGAECSVGQDPDPCGPTNICAGDFQLGHCAAPGSVPNSACIPDPSGATAGTCSDATLECVDFGFSGAFCLRSRTVGQTCNYFEDICAMGSSCVPTSQTDTRNGTCVADGAPGGLCSDSAMPPVTCMAGSSCIMTDPQASSGFCRTTAPVAAGGACDFSGRMNTCASGTTCAPSGTGGALTCQTNGSAAGTSCGTGGLCTGFALTCSATTGGFCETPAVTTCDPRYNTSACTAGNVCAATTISTGVCTAPTTEGTAANDTPATGQTITLNGMGTAAISGAITPSGDVDCYTFMAAANSQLYAEVNNGKAGCQSDEAVVILLFDAQGRLIDGNFATGQNNPCPLLDGVSSSASMSPAANLSAGQYSICVQAADQMSTTMNYVLDVTVQ